MKNRWPKRFVQSLASMAALVCAIGCSGASIPPPPGMVGVKFVNSGHPATDPWPQSVSVADFNGDGKLDLVVATYSNRLNVLLGNGDGTFTAAPAMQLAGAGETNNAAVADFNGDGKLDLAISLPDADEVQVLLGNGDGTFTPLPTIPVDGVHVVATADFNGDGKADLVLVNSGPGLVILLGNGDGTFTAAPPISAPSPQAVAVGDFNGDGKPDLAVVNYFANTVSVLLGRGDGTFTEAACSSATGFEPVSVVAADLNSDGVLDLVVTSLNGGAPGLGTVTVLLGKGDGTFTPAPVNPVPGSVPSSVTVADFNGDGKPDLAIANAGSNTLNVFLGNGDGTFIEPLSVAAGADPLYAAVGDFNGDGIPDLAVADSTSSSVTILLTQHTHTPLP